MNTPSNVLAESQSRVGAVAPVEITAARRLYWSVRREIWEYRSIYLGPLAVAAVFLAGFAIALIHLPQRMRAAATLSPMQQHAAIEQPYVIVAIMLMTIYLLIALFYCLDGLYGERRDRSVLFWKSLPVSDVTAVLSKASIAILVLPLVTFAVTVATHFIMLLVSSAVLAGSGMSVAPLWVHVPFFRTSGINLYHLLVFHGLWYAPFYGWLLLVSAWAKRAPLLWATVPPLAIGVVEKLAFNTSHFALLVRDRFTGGPMPQSDGMTMDMMAPHHLGYFLLSPGMWLGLALTGVFLFAAARLRRSRGPI